MEALYGDALHFSQRSTSTTLLAAHNKLRVLPQREPVVRSHKSPISPKYGYTNISLTLEKYHFSPPGNVTTDCTTLCIPGIISELRFTICASQPQPFSFAAGDLERSKPSPFMLRM